PLKSEIGVDDMSVADNDGRIIATAQEKTSDTFQPELVTLAQAQVQQSWVLFDEPHGLFDTAIYVISDAEQEPIAMMEAGAILGSKFLTDIKTRSNADLALIWNGQVRASTVDFGTNTVFPSVTEVDAQPGDVLIENIAATRPTTTASSGSSARSARTRVCSPFSFRPPVSSRRSAPSSGSSSCSGSASSRWSSSSPTALHGASPSRSRALLRPRSASKPSTPPPAYRRPRTTSS